MWTPTAIALTHQGSYGLLLLFAGLALVVSFLCSLLEAALFSARPTSLTAQRDAGHRGAGLLLELKEHRLEDAITAILIVNTVANSFGATMAGAQAELIWGGGIGIFAGVLTFMILVFSEIIPKTVGANYSEPLSGFVGYSLSALTILMTPLLKITGAFTRMLSPTEKSPMSRPEIAAFIAMATREGAIEGQEHRAMANVLRFSEVRVSDIMTPRTVAEMLPDSTTAAEYLEERRARAFSRVPIYSDHFDDVSGFVLAREVLRDLALGGNREQTLSHYRREVMVIPELAPIGKALEQFMSTHEHIAITIDEHGGVSGLVTLEDIIETLLGVEIVDEADRVANLRAVAADLRDRRLDTMKRREQLKEDIGEGIAGDAL